MQKITLRSLDGKIDSIATMIETLALSIKESFNSLETDVSDLKAGQKRLEDGQDDILLRLDQKVNKIDVPGWYKKHDINHN